MHYNNPVEVLNVIIKQLKIDVTHQGIIDEFEQYAYSFSLVSISDALTKWRISNAAYELSVEDLLDEDVPLPCIGITNNNQFIAILDIDKQRVLYTDGKSKNISIGLSEFEQKTKSTFLLIKRTEESGEEVEILMNLTTMFRNKLTIYSGRN